MRVDEGMDTGPILAQKAIEVGENTTTGELEAVLAEEGASLLVKTLLEYMSGEIVPAAQDSTKATTAPRIKKEDSPINWRKPANELHNQVRAMNPWPVASAFFRNQEVKIWRTETVSGNIGDFEGQGPGMIVAAGKDNLVVECEPKSFLKLKELQLPNRKRISARDFVNGTQLRIGESFR
jgi:methionyl-tRNA formyltransferase